MDKIIKKQQVKLTTEQINIALRRSHSLEKIVQKSKFKMKNEVINSFIELRSIIKQQALDPSSHIE